MKKDYERLPETVEISGTGISELTAKCVLRTDEKAIYYRWDNVYEVFRIKVAPPTEIYGRTYGEREVYPGNEDFGKTAWAYNNKVSAMERYDAL